MLALVPFVNRWGGRHRGLKDLFCGPMGMNVNFIRKIKQERQKTPLAVANKQEVFSMKSNDEIHTVPFTQGFR